MVDGPCHEAAGTRRSDGYVVVSIGGVLHRAHRLAYENEHGPVPDGFDVHHTCGNRGCDEPSHLEAIAKGEHGRLHSPHTGKTNCKHGHEYTEENTHVTASGKRVCRTCKRDHEYKRTEGKTRRTRRGRYARRP